MSPFAEAQRAGDSCCLPVDTSRRAPLRHETIELASQHNASGKVSQKTNVGPATFLLHFVFFAGPLTASASANLELMHTLLAPKDRQSFEKIETCRRRRPPVRVRPPRRKGREVGAQQVVSFARHRQGGRQLGFDRRSTTFVASATRAVKGLPDTYNCRPGWPVWKAFVLGSGRVVSTDTSRSRYEDASSSVPPSSPPPPPRCP